MLNFVALWCFDRYKIDYSNQVLTCSLASLKEREGLIWSDRVNLSNPGVFVVVVFVVVRGQSEQQSGQFSATIDQSDIRGSEPHNLDPSGAASDCYRESG